MNQSSSSDWAKASFLLLLVLGCRPVQAATPAFGDFDRRAQAGERLNVVFFGASLTWGPNATDPQPDLLPAHGSLSASRRGTRGLISNSGTRPSEAPAPRLGLFRLERDVLRRKPDLVFLDFSANDGIFSDNPETLASYEAIVRRLIQEAGAPVVQVLFPFQWDAAAGKLEGMKRREAHLALAHAYGTAAGDAIALAQERVRQGKSTLQQIWPVDGVHPGDAGYTLFADAAWLAFQQAVREKKTCTLPEKMLYAPTYLASARVRLSSLGPLPEGWRVGAPNVVSAYFDMLMSRWLDDEVIASNRRPGAGPGKTRESVVEKVAPLRLRFRGSMVMLFGESTMKSGKYRAFIDGQLVEHREGNPAQGAARVRRRLPGQPGEGKHSPRAGDRRRTGPEKRAYPGDCAPVVAGHRAGTEAGKHLRCRRSCEGVAGHPDQAARPDDRSRGTSTREAIRIPKDALIVHLRIFSCSRFRCQEQGQTLFLASET